MPVNSNQEDTLDDLVNRVRNRKTDKKRPSIPSPDVNGLKPSEILFLSGDEKKLINYLSHKRYASIEEIEQSIQIDHAQALKILSSLDDNGHVHKALVNGKIFYRIRYVKTLNKSNVPQKILSTLSLDSVAFLHQLPLFKNLTETDINFISQQFNQNYYARNDIILQQGNASKSFFIVKSGVVAILSLSNSGEYNLVSYLEQGDFFGESSLLTGQAVSATIIAFTPVNILMISKDNFYALLSKHIEITIELARTLAHRISDSNVRLAHKHNNTNIFLIISTGKQLGASTIANAIALTITSSNKTSTAYIEFPQKGLASIYGFPENSIIYNHPGGFQILHPKTETNIPEMAQVSLIIDQASVQFENIVICISWELVQQLESLVSSASEIVVVTSHLQKDWKHTQKVILSLKPYVRANKSRLFTIANHTQPDTSDELHDADADPDFVIPFLDNLHPISERLIDSLPAPLTKIVAEMLKSLEYTNQIGVYIPTTININKEVNTSSYVEKTLSFMGKLFGGATHEQVQGVWNSQGIGLVEEDIHLIRSFCNQAVLDKHMGEVVDYVEAMKQELQQEAMAIEVNQKLMLI